MVENKVYKNRSTDNNHNTEIAWSFKCLWTVINNSDDEIEEIKAEIIAAY
jgi:hypothetical protein